LFSVDLPDGHPLLTVALSSPPATNDIHIERNQIRAGSVAVREQDAATAVLQNDHIIIRVSVTDENDLAVDLDLRPVGLNVYTDQVSLHIGGATLAGNVIQRSRVAINIG
jgi:hypothetical protein